VTSELHVTFNIPYVHDFITQLCKQQEIKLIHNHANAAVCNIEQGEEAMYKKYKRLKLDGGQAYDHSSD
jgi:hypothetical protein